MLGGGLPVNRAAMKENLRSIEAGSHFMTYGFDAYNLEAGSQKSVITEVYWPDEGFQQRFLNVVETLQTPYVDGAGVQNACRPVGEQYVLGKISLEEALNKAESQLRLMTGA